MVERPIAGEGTDGGTSGQRSPPLLVGHVATPNDAAEMLRTVCGVSVSQLDVEATQVSLNHLPDP